MATKVITDKKIVCQIKNKQKISMRQAWKLYRFRQLCSALKKGYICYFSYVKENGELRTAWGKLNTDTLIQTSKNGNQYIEYLEYFDNGNTAIRRFRTDRFLNFNCYLTEQTL